ncbi:MAG: DUF2807 domain-containing protein [Tannerellaceae bacterium]|jgi:hypothetical protein|nr:DUF2807 domain-containing protein [Tannerellaceae bacterium]
MKAKSFITCGALAAGMLLNGCVPFHVVKGDGDLVTREINVGDYSEIEASLSSNMEINYTQSGEATELSVLTDRNILEKYDIRVEGQTLKILPKEEYMYRARVKTTQYNAMFLPTKFIVTTASKGLRIIDTAGGVNFTVDNALHTDELKISAAGSAKINFRDTLTADNIRVSVAGSGTLNASALEARSFEGEIAGSGRMNMGGHVEKLSFEIAGSGKIRAFDLQAEDVEVEIAGSGNIEISVNNSISAEIAGSGSIKYKGDPSHINKDVMGSGTIKKVD